MGWLMRPLATMFLSSLLLPGCSSLSGQGDPASERRVVFACDDGETVEVRYFPLQGVAVLVRHGKTIELQQQPSGSGFIYSNGPSTVRGKGDEISVEIGRRVPIMCKAH